MNGTQVGAAETEGGPGSGCSAALLRQVSPTAAQREWQELEVRADPSFFLSWHWIGTWLSCLPPAVRPLMQRVQCNGRTVGLALVVRRSFWRNGFVRSRAVHLNCTGDEKLDEITIEHNGWLAERGFEDEVTRAGLHGLVEGTAWDEIFLDGVTRPERLAELATQVGKVRELVRSPSHYVDLEKVRTSGSEYSASLGKRTRYQLRRAAREYEKHGPLRTEEARDVAEAKRFLRGLQGYHQKHWQARGKPGSFANEFFVRFHDQLIERSMASGAIQLLRLTAGERELGYLYNHVYRGHVYVYQTGFNYTNEGPYDRPGVVCHLLAVEHNLKAGHGIYDFSAGDSEYKRVLSNAQAPLGWLVLQAPRARFTLEDWARRMRRKMRKEPAVAAEGSGEPAESEVPR